MQKTWKTQMRNDTRETIQTYRNNMIRLVLILLKWHQKWKEARWFPTNDTVIICPKKPRRWPLCLSAIQTDSSDALCYRLWSWFFFSSHAPRPCCHLPSWHGLCYQPGLLNSKEELPQKPLLSGQENCSFSRCLNRTDTQNVRALWIEP